MMLDGVIIKKQLKDGNTKQKFLEEYVKTVPIDIEYMPYEQIVEIVASNTKNTPISEHVVVNYIRHRLSNYDVINGQLRKICKSYDAVSQFNKKIKERVNNKIVDLYPQLNIIDKIEQKVSKPLFSKDL
jgi:hypothetical protein